jgi:DNA-directed RNA polymerase subunit M/transcription elongation factor TFIIS
MKCTNPTKCDGEMSTYKGIEAGKVECSTCGYRIDAPKAKAPEKKEVVSTENKETK